MCLILTSTSQIPHFKTKTGQISKVWCPVFLVVVLIDVFFFFLRGDLPPGPVAQELRDLQEKERKLDELIQICTRHIHQMCENRHTRKYPFCSVKDYHMHINPPYSPNYYYSNIIPLPFLANLFAWMCQLTLWLWLLCASPSAWCIYLNPRDHVCLFDLWRCPKDPQLKRTDSDCDPSSCRDKTGGATPRRGNIFFLVN